MRIEIKSFPGVKDVDQGYQKQTKMTAKRRASRFSVMQPVQRFICVHLYNQVSQDEGRLFSMFLTFLVSIPC